jgi:hypothetical protein
VVLADSQFAFERQKPLVNQIKQLIAKFNGFQNIFLNHSYFLILLRRQLTLY